MCLNKSEITNPYTHKRLWVSCGHCPACLQSKSFRRVRRIEANQSVETVTLFCTLTYANRFIPYFVPGEFKNNESGQLVIYRDAQVNWKRTGTYKNGRHKHSRMITFKREKLMEIDVDNSLFNAVKDHKYQNIRGISYPRVGVLYQPDFANFIKRLKINLKRKYNYEKPFSYVYVGEYGPRTLRPHFHALITVPIADYALFKTAISKAWSFDDYRQCRANISIAKNAASYVSSYINCASYVPLLYRSLAEIRPCYHISKNFGFSKKSFSLLEVCKAIDARNLRFDVPKTIGNASVVVPMLLPKYVINRYFPKFKGYRFLNASEIVDVYTTPSSLIKYSGKCGLDFDETRHIIGNIRKHQNYAVSQGLTIYDYAFYAFDVHKLYASNLLEDFYKELNEKPSFIISEFYDNLHQRYHYYTQPYLTEYIDSLKKYDPRFYLLSSPNASAIQAAKDEVLVKLYNLYDKSKKIRANVYFKTSPKFHI